MKRRKFVALVAGGLVCGPVLARAQTKAMPVIGFLSGTRLDAAEVGAVKRGLADNGYRDPDRIRIEYHSAEGKYDRLPDLAADLARRKVAVIIAIGGTVSVRAAKAATTTIPIIFATAGDPVKLGLVASLNEPGGNVTGASFLVAGLAAKRLELLHDVVPRARMIGMLANPLNPNAAAETRDATAASASLGQTLMIRNASNDADIASAFDEFARQKVEAVLVAADAVFTSHRKQLAVLAASHSVPAIYALPEFVAAGGLMSYGPSRVEAFRLVGALAAKVLAGSKPAGLPVEQSTKIELAINVKTAKALDLSIPPKLLTIADEVVE